MGERKQPYKYLSKVYICPGFFLALLCFAWKNNNRGWIGATIISAYAKFILAMEISTLAGMSTRQYITLLLPHKSALLWSLCWAEFEKVCWENKNKNKQDIITVLFLQNVVLLKTYRAESQRIKDKIFKFSLYTSFSSFKPELEPWRKQNYVVEVQLQTEYIIFYSVRKGKDVIRIRVYLSLRKFGC